MIGRWSSRWSMHAAPPLVSKQVYSRRENEAAGVAVWRWTDQDNQSTNLTQTAALSLRYIFVMMCSRIKSPDVDLSAAWHGLSGRFGTNVMRHFAGKPGGARHGTAKHSTAQHSTAQYSEAIACHGMTIL